MRYVIVFHLEKELAIDLIQVAANKLNKRQTLTQTTMKVRVVWLKCGYVKAITNYSIVELSCFLVQEAL